MLAIILVN